MVGKTLSMFLKKYWPTALASLELGGEGVLNTAKRAGIEAIAAARQAPYGAAAIGLGGAAAGHSLAGGDDDEAEKIADLLERIANKRRRYDDEEE